MSEAGDPQYKEIVLVRIGEIALKGSNRTKFYQQLIRNIRYRLCDLGKFSVVQSHTRIWISSKDGDFPGEEILDRLTNVFGIVSASLVRSFPADEDLLWQQLKQYGDSIFAGGEKKTFKVETRRVNKKFPLNSYEVSCNAGTLILDCFADMLTVDVHNPDITIYIEIRDQIYLFSDKTAAPKGLPVGMGGNGLVLLSGGLDSPVAAWMMASRGMELDMVYFHTPPYTSDKALDKVISLATVLAGYIGNHTLHIVNFTAAQLELNEKCPQEMLTIVMRRMMMRIASEIAAETKAKALVTGESLGQVASQTLEALTATNAVTELLVFRPLIGKDKDEIVSMARKIGTYETSIEPFEDCCTVFVSRHPKTHPSLEDAARAERNLDIETLVKESLANTKSQKIYLRDSFKQ